MNERIKELIAAASGRPIEQVNNMTWKFEEKFAELIMAECAIACEDIACNTTESPSNLIKYHFNTTKQPDVDLYFLIRSFGYTTSSQTDELVEAIMTKYLKVPYER